eukprot:763969-Hanusia_phi.AAC.1
MPLVHPEKRWPWLKSTSLEQPEEEPNELFVFNETIGANRKTSGQMQDSMTDMSTRTPEQGSDHGEQGIMERSNITHLAISSMLNAQLDQSGAMVWEDSRGCLRCRQGSQQINNSLANFDLLEWEKVPRLQADPRIHCKGKNLRVEGAGVADETTICLPAVFHKFGSGEVRNMCFCVGRAGSKGGGTFEVSSPPELSRL